MNDSTNWRTVERTCVFCNQNYLPKTNWQKTCSYECGYALQNQKKVRGQTNFGECARCGASLANKRANAIYCSKTCKCMDHTYKHRPKTRIVNTARRVEIYKRDNGQCYMCHEKLPLEKIELDHLVPVSRGGTSDSKNVAVSCQFCNRSRGNRIELAQLQKISELRMRA